MKLNDVLSPKNPKEINEEIKKLSSFEFIYAFSDLNINNYKVSLKKRILYFMCLSNKIPKFINFSRYAIIGYFLWLCFDIITTIFLNKILAPYITLCCAILYCIIAIFIFSSTITKQQFKKWLRQKKKKYLDEFREERNRRIQEIFATFVREQIEKRKEAKIKVKRRIYDNAILRNQVIITLLNENRGNLDHPQN